MSAPDADASTSARAAFNANAPSVKRILREIRELRAERGARARGVHRRTVRGRHLRISLRRLRTAAHGVRARDIPRKDTAAAGVSVQAAGVRAADGERAIRDGDEDLPEHLAAPPEAVAAELVDTGGADGDAGVFPDAAGGRGRDRWIGATTCRRELAEASWRAREPTFAHGCEKRRALSASVHERMLARAEAVMAMESVKTSGDDGASASASGAGAENAIEDDDANEDDVEDEATAEGGSRSRAFEDDDSPVAGSDERDAGVEPPRAIGDEDVAREEEREDDDDEDPPRPVTPPNETEREARLARRARELAKTKQQLDTTAWALVFAIVAITIKRLVVQRVIGALQ